MKGDIHERRFMAGDQTTMLTFAKRTWENENSTSRCTWLLPALIPYAARVVAQSQLVILYLPP